ncbi:MAG: hypothetical protein U0Q19_13175 [Kineosporiaceae bacterium]
MVTQLAGRLVTGHLNRIDTGLPAVLVTLALTGFAVFCLFVLGSVFRTTSEILYRRSQRLVFQVPRPHEPRAPIPTHLIPGGPPVIRAALLLIGLALLAKLVGVGY